MNELVVCINALKKLKHIVKLMLKIYDTKIQKNTQYDSHTPGPILNITRNGKFDWRCYF